MTWQVRKAVLPAILVVAAVAGAIVLVRTKPVVAPSDKVEQPWLVSVSAVTLADVQPTLRLFGEIVPGREVELRALVAGEVVAVGEAFVDGGVVAKGTMIIGIDAFDYQAKFDELSAQIGEARARLEEITAHRMSYQSALARDRELVKLHLRDVERMRSLSGQGTVSAKRMDTARMELTKQRKATEMRQSDLAAETAHVKQQKAVIQRLGVGLRRAERDLQRVRLTAPFDGYLADVQAQVGRRLNANDQVARLVDANRLEARLTLSDSQYGRLVSEGPLAGRPVQIIWRVGGKSFPYAGRLDRIGARIDSTSGGVRVFARLDGADRNKPRRNKPRLSSPLRPGAFVSITLPDQIYHQVARLPESALYHTNAVYVVKGERLEKRAVQLLARVGNDVLLRGELEDGDQVVTTRFAEIGPGQKVEVR